MKRILTVIAVLLAFCVRGRAQFASLGSEKGTTNWEQLTSPNYKVIFPVGTDSLGLVYSTYLEHFRPLVGNSAGYFPNQFYKKPMPVILHADAAISNGAVVWAPRRMDLYTFQDAYSALPPMPWEKALAIHENRHVAQMQFTKDGFWKYLYWPYGEIGLMLVSSLYSNAAFLEGDAVVAETALTNSGRGRSADFLAYIRMSFANGDMRDWFRWRYGSQRLYTPDYYKVGYMTVAGMRYNYDATMFMRDYLKNLTSPFGMDAVQKTMRKYSGKRIKGTWNDIAATFKDIWAQDDSLRAPFQEIITLVPDTRFYTNYRSAVQTKDGRVFSVRVSLDREMELVEILQDGTVKPIRPMSADSKLVYSPYTDCIYWSEAVPDPRWDMVQTSRIRYIHVGEKAIQDLTKQWRYVNPAVSDDGTRIAAAEYASSGATRIVELSPSTGDEIRAITVPSGLQVTETAFLGDLVAFAGISEGGTGLYLTDFSTVSPLEEASPIRIKNLISHNGKLYFTSDRTGTNEIYSYTPQSLTQLTNTHHGVAYPFFKDDALCFSALTPSGYLLATVDAPLSRSALLSDYASYPIADFLSAQEKEFAEAPIEDIPPVKSKYSKAANFFHVHSWLPIYFNMDSFSASQSEFGYEMASMGGVAFFQNLTGTASGSLGLSVHEDAFDADKLAAGFHARLKYTGLYPVFDLSFDVGDRQRAAISKALVPANDSTFLATAPAGGTYVGGSLGVSFPLDFSSGGRETTVEPSITLKLSNDALGESFAFYDKKGEYEITSLKSGSSESGRDYYTCASVVARVAADTRRSMSPSQIIPRLGVGGELRAVFAPFDMGIGSGMYASAYAYLPGLMSTHGVKLSAAVQSRTQMFESRQPAGFYSNYMLPVDVWGLGFEDMAPRGFEKTGAGATMLLFSPVSSLFSLDYVFPMLYVDRAFGPYIYLSNMEVNPFADLSLYNPMQTEYLYSAGADIVFRFEKLFMFSNTMKLGARIAYNGGSSVFDKIGMESPVYVGFVANTAL